MIYTQSTFRQLTAPGYFDFSGQQTEKTRRMVAWFDGVMAILAEQVNLFDNTFRLWATRDYSAVTVSITPYLQYLQKQWGIEMFRGTIAQVVAMIGYVSKSYPESIVLCLQQLFSFLYASPFQWISGSEQILFAPSIPARFAEALLIYSSSVSPPSTPSPTAYAALAWNAPAGWSKTASSSTYYARGYLSGGNIVWMTPRSTTGISLTKDVAILADLPGAPSTGDLCGVADDGTGDVGAVYYYDGSIWRKTTTPNANQGLVVGGEPPVPGSSVWATQYTLSSGEQPPVSGPSQGYGYYGIWGQFEIKAKQINVVLSLTDAGVQNLGIIVFLLRKIKPSINALFLNYNTPESATYVTIEIFDSGAI